MNILESLTPQAYAMEQLIETIASCAAFQEACGVTNEEDAKQFIYPNTYFVPGLEVRKPFAVPWTPQGGGLTTRKLADGRTVYSGTIDLQLGMPIYEPDNMEQADRDFANLHGQIIDWICREPDAGYILKANQIEGPAFTTPAELKALGGKVPFWSVGYQIEWDPFG